MFNVTDMGNCFCGEFYTLGLAINWVKDSTRLPVGDYIFGVSLHNVHLLNVRIKSYGQIDNENMYMIYIDIPDYKIIRG